MRSRLYLLWAGAWLTTNALVTRIRSIAEQIIYNINGVSGVIVKAMTGIADAAAALGFAIYSVIMVLLLMFLLDLLQAVFDPRVRQGIFKK